MLLRERCDECACRNPDSEVNPEVVMVTWIDSGMAHYAEWLNVDDIVATIHEDPDYMRTVSVGYLIHRDDKHLVLAQTWSRSTSKYMNAETIYAPCVEDIVTLVPGKIVVT
jgi:hypothetical protein